MISNIKNSSLNTFFNLERNEEFIDFTIVCAILVLVSNTV